MSNRKVSAMTVDDLAQLRADWEKAALIERLAWDAAQAKQEGDDDEAA